MDLEKRDQTLLVCLDLIVVLIDFNRAHTLPEHFVNNVEVGIIDEIAK